MIRIFKNKIIIILTIFLILIPVLIFSFFHFFPKRNIYIWAWERPEDFSFLAHSRDNLTIIYYAGGIVIRDGKLKITERLNHLVIPANLKNMPIIRIDNFDGPESLTDEKLAQITNFIINICSNKDIVGCQVDFDVTSSLREKYKILLASVKNKIPSTTSLSITALVSWCDKFSWLNKTNIDFAVPMFYRLGDDREKIDHDYIGETFMKSPKCKNAIGVSLDEPLQNKKYISGRDIYFFNPNSWSEQSYSTIINMYGR